MVWTVIAKRVVGRRRKLSAVLALSSAVLLTAAACGPGGPSSVPPVPLDSGIRGFVQLGPTCPVETRDVPCTTPYVAVLVILDLEQQEVTRVTSDPDGRFEVLLAPGEYTIAPTPGGDPLPSASPQAVSVVAGSFAEVEINYDTGIRGAE
ncbi:MAG: hypothetical protein H0T04_04885 [Chloroflexi bacterium]|nr:hypothetical protein [Chloroflexota bacterium]MBA3850801.1 hypothetical protein [Chloroflexota bacterium]